MWEVGIQVKSAQTKLADYLFNQLKKQIGEFGAIVTKVNQEPNITIVMACKKYDQARIKILTQNLIVEAICTFFKEDYLNKFLSLPIKEGIYYKALKKALLNFDRETDCYIVTKELELSGTINLEAFYYFKLKPLREKWAELISIANENGLFLVSNDNFVDLLKFLVDNLEISHDTINIHFENSSFKIQDGRNRDLLVDFDEDDLVCSIIDLSPRQINFYGGEIREENVELLKKIFDKRVNFFLKSHL